MLSYRYTETPRLTLILNGLKFHSTWSSKSKEDALTCKRAWAERGRTLILKNFGVDIDTFDPETHIVTNWRKYKGFSLREQE